MNCYCLFHNSGFRTYKINGEPNESMTQMVSSENNYNYPSEAARYLGDASPSFSYKYLDANSITIVVKDIPSIREDTNGNPVPCAFQIVGSCDEKDKLDRIASKLKEDTYFNDFFKNLFSLRGGLHIDGAKLFQYLEEAKDFDKISISPEPVIDKSNPRNPEKKKVKKVIGSIMLVIVAIIAIFAHSSKDSSKQSNTDSFHLMICKDCKKSFRINSKDYQKNNDELECPYCGSKNLENNE